MMLVIQVLVCMQCRSQDSHQLLRMKMNMAISNYVTGLDFNQYIL